MRRTFLRGDDFEVFWKISEAFLAQGTSPYSVETYGRMVFKYPPWIVPAFLPFAAFPMAIAKLFWGLIEAGSLGAVIIYLHRPRAENAGVRPGIQAFVLLVFGGMIGLHGLVGQITLPLLACALWASTGSASQIALSYAYSSKLLTVLPLVEVFRLPNWKRILLGSLGVAALLSLPVLMRAYAGDVAALIADWRAAMFSGTQVQADQFIGFNTREAQGLTGLVLRVFSLDQTHSALVLSVTLASFVAVAAGFFALSRRWSRTDRWYGWLALTPVVQPLAWLHFFLLAYPLVVVGLERARVGGRRGLFAGLIISAILIGAVTEKTLGHFGFMLEMLSIKSWGVFLALFCFARLRDSRTV